MYRFLISIGVALAGAICCHAAEVARVTVNGEPVSKVVTAITFDGDQAVIHFGDADRMEADMGDVKLSFAADGTSAIGSVSDLSVFSYDGIVGDLLKVSGLSGNTALTIHDVAGKTVFGPVAAQGEMEINVSSLRPGVYVLRAGKDVVKFTKH